MTIEGQTAILAAFHKRREIAWFGLRGAFDEAGAAIIVFAAPPEGVLGGGGTDAINGGVIAAGFDAAAVLAGLGAYDTDTIATVSLTVNFLALAPLTPSLRWRARVARAGGRLAFIEADLADAEACFATASAVVAPIGGRTRS